MKRSMFLACLLLLSVSLAVPAMASDPPSPGVVISAYTGSEAFITRGERREYLTARGTAFAPLFGPVSAFTRVDVGGQQDGGSLEADPSSFRRLELAGGLGYELGPVRLAGVAGVTYSIEGEADAPQDPRLYTLAAMARVGVGEDGYVLAGGGHVGPLGGWGLLGAISVPAGPAYAVVDYAFPLSVTALQERAWTLRVGAQVRVKRFVLAAR